MRFQLFRLSSIVLIGTPASPTYQYFAQDTKLYATGDLALYNKAYSPDTTPVVSLRFLFHYATTDFSPRCSNSPRPELLQLALVMGTKY